MVVARDAGEAPGRVAQRPPLAAWAGQPELVTVPVAAGLLGVSAYRLRCALRENEVLRQKLTVLFSGRRRLVVTRRLKAWLEGGMPGAGRGEVA